MPPSLPLRICRASSAVIDTSSYVRSCRSAASEWYAEYGATTNSGNDRIM